MSALKMLQQRRADMVREADGLFEAAANENREMSAEEIARYNELEASLASVEDQILMAERHKERQRSMAPAEASVADFAPAAAPLASPYINAGAGAATKFATFGDQLMAVVRAGSPNANGRWDPRLQAATGMSEGIGAEGGFLVQQEFLPELLTNVWGGGEIASRVRKIPLGPNSNGIRMNGVDETSRANGSRWGGIQSFWTGEAQLKNASQPRFKQIRMELDKLTGLLYATDELLQDAIALEAWLKQTFEDEFTFKIEDSIVNGTGAGQPLGLLASGAAITVAKETGQPNATILADNILNMWMRMPPRSQANAVWLVNLNTQAQFFKLYSAIKNVAGTENVGGISAPEMIYRFPGSPGGGQFGTLMGRPVIPCEYCATLGTPGDIILADLNQYLAIDKGQMQTASSIHVRFIYDETVFRFVYRYNGGPLWTTAVTPYKGSTTVSPFVILAQR